MSKPCSDNVYNTIYLRGENLEAHAWLDDAVLKTEALTMSPTEFRTAFRTSQLLAHTTCACGQDVDVLGVHTQCRLDGNLTSSTHNRLVACLAEMIRSCGQSVRVEVTGIFNNVDLTSNQRMDLVVYDPGCPNPLYDQFSNCGGLTFRLQQKNIFHLIKNSVL